MWHVVCVLSATLPTFGAPFDGYQYNWVGIMLYACHRVLWDTRIKLWDPGQSYIPHSVSLCGKPTQDKGEWMAT